jgi:hypothetical protein
MRGKQARSAIHHLLGIGRENHKCSLARQRRVAATSPSQRIWRLILQEISFRLIPQSQPLPTVLVSRENNAEHSSGRGASLAPTFDLIYMGFRFCAASKAEARKDGSIYFLYKVTIFANKDSHTA